MHNEKIRYLNYLSLFSTWHSVKLDDPFVWTPSMAPYCRKGNGKAFLVAFMCLSLCSHPSLPPHCLLCSSPTSILKQSSTSQLLSWNLCHLLNDHSILKCNHPEPHPVRIPSCSISFLQFIYTFEYTLQFIYSLLCLLLIFYSLPIRMWVIQEEGFLSI